MNEEKFWKIIDLLDWSDHNSGNEVIMPAVIELSKYEISDILLFQNELSKKLYTLDQKIFAQNIGKNSFSNNRYFSADLFLYIRACVIANGKATYQEVLNNPTEMPKDADFEDLLYIASKAYSLKTGGETLNFMPEVSYETFSNQKGWDLAIPNYITSLLSA